MHHLIPSANMNGAPGSSLFASPRHTGSFTRDTTIVFVTQVSTLSENCHC